MSFGMFWKKKIDYQKFEYLNMEKYGIDKKLSEFRYLNSFKAFPIFLIEKIVKIGKILP